MLDSIKLNTVSNNPRVFYIPLPHQIQERAGLVKAWTQLVQHGVDQKKSLLLHSSENKSEEMIVLLLLQ